MNEKAIKILTSEPCVSWLRERWERQEADQFINVNFKSYDIQKYGLPTIWYIGPFCKPEKMANWLPRIGDFLGEKGLLAQADASAINLFFDEVNEPRMECYNWWGTRLDLDASDLLLACAEALELLLEDKNKEDK